MGDRGNIVVRQGIGNQSDVWFYTHWSGADMPEVVKAALARKWRWSDEPYLARIIFDELTADCQGQETGFGISTCIGDNSHPVLVVDAPNKRVYTIQESELIEGRIPPLYKPKDAVSFHEYAGLPAKD